MPTPLELEKAIHEIEQQMINSAIWYIREGGWNQRGYGRRETGDISHRWLDDLKKRGPAAIQDPDTYRAAMAFINDRYRTGFDRYGTPQYNIADLITDDLVQAVRAAEGWTFRLENRSGNGYWYIYRQTAGDLHREHHRFPANAAGNIIVPVAILERVVQTGVAITYNRHTRTLHVTTEEGKRKTEKRYIGKTITLARVRKALSDG